MTILRDDWGVPHIYAATESDGYFGLGYAMGEDRLESVLRRYLAVTGRLASVYGPDSLEKDMARLQWMHFESARAGLANMSPELRADYRMFIRGLQQYIQEHPSQTPSWVPILEPALPVAWGRAWIFYWNEAAEECVAGGAPVPATTMVGQSKYLQPLSASNAWTVAPWRSAQRSAMFVGDSHSQFTGNGEMFEFHLDAGNIKVTGTSGVALPWVIVGHTRSVAWTTTNRSYDAADCYRVEVDPSNPRRYRYDGQWRTMSTRTVTVPVNGAVPVTRVFEYTTHNGELSPVIARRGNVAWIASDPYMGRAGRIDEQLYRHLKAQNVMDLLAAHREQDMWPTNLMAADASGNIQYLRTGRIPIRPAGVDWSRPVDGNVSATAWKGIHGLSDLVQSQNPASGYMQNNNVSPDMMFEGSPLTPDRYAPEVYGEPAGSTNFRGKRAVDLLSRAVHASMNDMLAILFDERWEDADRWQEALRRAVSRRAAATQTQPARVRALMDRLLHFDLRAEKESIAALSYLYWRRAISENAPINRELNALIRHDSLPGVAYDSALVAAVSRALGLLDVELGPADHTFGDVFRVGRGNVSLPLGGFVGTMRAMVFGPPDAKHRQWVQAGQRQPLVVLFTNPIQSFSSLNFGQSNDPRSPHYADQSRLMSEKRLKPTYFYEADLLKHVEQRRTLKVPTDVLQSPGPR